VPPPARSRARPDPHRDPSAFDAFALVALRPVLVAQPPVVLSRTVYAAPVMPGLRMFTRGSRSLPGRPLPTMRQIPQPADRIQPRAALPPSLSRFATITGPIAATAILSHLTRPVIASPISGIRHISRPIHGLAIIRGPINRLAPLTGPIRAITSAATIRGRIDSITRVCGVGAGGVGVLAGAVVDGTV
jgi:hypothetical protein